MREEMKVPSRIVVVIDSRVTTFRSDQPQVGIRSRQRHMTSHPYGTARSDCPTPHPAPLAPRHFFIIPCFDPCTDLYCILVPHPAYRDHGVRHQLHPDAQVADHHGRALKLNHLRGWGGG